MNDDFEALIEQNMVKIKRINEVKSLFDTAKKSSWFYEANEKFNKL